MVDSFWVWANSVDYQKISDLLCDCSCLFSYRAYTLSSGEAVCIIYGYVRHKCLGGELGLATFPLRHTR